MITTELNEEWGRNKQADNVFEVRAIIQDAYNTLEERTTKLEELVAGSEFTDVDDEIKTQGAACIAILKKAKTDLDEYKDLINWTQP